jgi:transforming growth factor-beta-induced protein
VIEVQPTASLTGTIRRQAGPAQGIMVSAAGLSAQITPGEGSATFIFDDNLTPGQVTLMADAPGHLACVASVTVNAGDNTIEETITLLAGDVDNDGDVDIADSTLIGLAFGTSGEGPNTVDLDGSGSVNILDLIFIGLNFDRSGPQECFSQPDLPTIVEIAVADDRFETLVAALTAADLVDTLNGEGPFTVFAPTDDAFAALPPGTLDSLLADIPALTNILLYHVAAGEATAAQLAALPSITTLQGAGVSITPVEGGLILNDTVNVILADIQASNGIIHVIDAVLIPPTEEELPTIVEIAVADDRFETLVAALTAADLVDTLNGEGPFTVFAPTDDAFAALPPGTLDSLLADIPALTNILLYHVAAGEATAAQLAALPSITTLQGAGVSITPVEGGLILNDTVNVILADIQASNGIIHVIDAVLIPPTEEELPTIVEIAVADDRFETLVAALTAADLVDTLNGEGPFTVFAPTDDAFAALPPGTLDALLADIPALTNILLYHVAAGEATAAQLAALPSITTLQGAGVSITPVEGGLILNDTVNVILADIQASNGIIHVIDAVLIPPADEE